MQPTEKSALVDRRLFRSVIDIHQSNKPRLAKLRVALNCRRQRGGFAVEIDALRVRGGVAHNCCERFLLQERVRADECVKRGGHDVVVRARKSSVNASV